MLPIHYFPFGRHFLMERTHINPSRLLTLKVAPKKISFSACLLTCANVRSSEDYVLFPSFCFSLIYPFFVIIHADALESWGYGLQAKLDPVKGRCHIFRPSFGRLPIKRHYSCNKNIHLSLTTISQKPQCMPCILIVYTQNL